MKSEKEFNSEERISNSIKLHAAIDNNNIDELEKILAAGNVDINYEYSGILDIDIPPLYKLSMLCRRIETISEDDALKMMQILIKYGADVNREWDGMSALFCAIGLEPKYLLIKCLLDAGADVNLGSYATPLGIGFFDINELLLIYGADINSNSKYAERELSHFDEIKHKIENSNCVFNSKIYDTVYKPSYNLYTIADFVDSLFNRKDKDAIQKKLKIALGSEYKFNYSHDHIDFMIDRFKNLCAIKNSKLTSEELISFTQYLEQIITYDFLPEKLKNGLQYILEDHDYITNTIESFALWDALCIHAEEIRSKQIEAPISFKQANDMLSSCDLEDSEIFYSILNFCNEHPIYKGHSYLKDESSKNEIVRIMLKHTDFSTKVREFFTKYKGIFDSDILKQAINDYDHVSSLTGDVNLLSQASEEILI